jgi:hypothetical protein
MPETNTPVWTRVDRERRLAIHVSSAVPRTIPPRDVATADAAFLFGFSDRSADETSIGPVPLVVRPLRLSSLPLLTPFGKRRQAAVREIATREPRITRLWERFSVDVGVAVERDSSFVNEHVLSRLDRGYRVLIFEDGDRYAIRAMCIFKIAEDEGPARTGYVVELLHDRSVAGMRSASHLLGLAVREMSDRGAHAVHAWSFPHSGTFPLFVLHGFVPMPARLRSSQLQLSVHALDPAMEPIVRRRENWYVSYLDAVVSGISGHP